MKKKTTLDILSTSSMMEQENLGAKTSFGKSHRGRKTPRDNVTNVMNFYVSNVTYEFCMVNIMGRDQFDENENVNIKI